MGDEFKVVDKTKRKILLTFLLTFVLAKKGLRPVIHFIYLTIIGVLSWMCCKNIPIPIAMTNHQTNLLFTFGVIVVVASLLAYITKKVNQ